MISAAVKTQKGESFNQPVGELTHLPIFAAKSVTSLQLPTSTVQPTLSQVNRRKVLFVTSELADLVKTGGLGDVS
ncbi:starch synthase, partial [Pseudomonas syringae pv. actinidiae]|nr:starch synthase [Pseudomonas syringae pv. actinidiae]